jgi:hypothetical protein
MAERYQRRGMFSILSNAGVVRCPRESVEQWRVKSRNMTAQISSKCEASMVTGADAAAQAEKKRYGQCS